MPSRTDEEKIFIQSMSIIEPSETCNARTPNGYCKQRAGFGTNHLGTGRCKYHGGSSDGRPVVTGAYSSYLNSTVGNEFKKIVEDEKLVSLTSELAVVKAMLTDLLNNIKERMDEDGSNWWTQEIVTQFGSKSEISPEAKLLMNLTDNIGRLATRITDAEEKMSKNFDVRNIFAVITQIKNLMDSKCEICPVRKEIAKGLKDMKIAGINK